MESFEYDVVIYGTGLVNCLVGSILTKRNLKVLQVDKNSEYGNSYRTLSFRQLLELRNAVPLIPEATPGSEDADQQDGSQSEREQLSVKSSVSDYLVSRNASIFTGSSLSSLHSSSTVRNLESDLEQDGDSGDPTGHTHSLGVLSEGQSTNRSSAQSTGRTNGPFSERGRADEEPIYYQVSPFGENREQVLSSLVSQSSSFNVDLWPRFLLGNSLFTEFLIRTNLHKQLQLCTNNDVNVYFAEEEKIVWEDGLNEPELDKEPSTDIDEVEAEVKSKKGKGGGAVDAEGRADGHGKGVGNKEDVGDDKVKAKGKDKEKKKGEDKRNKNKEDKDKEGGVKESSFLHELVYDKNSIFRSNYLDLKEKRALNKFLFNVYNEIKQGERKERGELEEEGEGAKHNAEAELEAGDGADENRTPEEKDKVAGKRGKGGKEAKEGKEGKHKSDRGKSKLDGNAVEGKRKDRKNNKSEGGGKVGSQEGWVEYLGKNRLNARMINVINCMCLALEPPLTRAQGWPKLASYVKAFDTPNRNNKNCLIYCLYGTNNLIQHICRLSSLHNCHLMLNNQINAIGSTTVSKKLTLPGGGDDRSSADDGDGSGSDNPIDNNSTSNYDNNDGDNVTDADDTAITTTDTTTNTATDGTTATDNPTSTNTTSNVDSDGGNGGKSNGLKLDGDADATASATASINSVGTGSSTGGSLKGDDSARSDHEATLHSNDTTPKNIEHSNTTTDSSRGAKTTTVDSNTNTTNSTTDNNSSTSANTNNGEKCAKDEGQAFDRNIILRLDGYQIYTDYLISEYPVEGLVEGELASGKLECGGRLGVGREDRRLLVLCVISDRRVLRDLNGCMVLGRGGGEGARDLTFVFQACRESQSAPENVYVVYLLKMTKDRDPKLDLGRVDGVNEENDVYRLINLYGKFTDDLSHILFMWYTTFRTKTNVDFICKHYTDNTATSTTTGGGSNGGNEERVGGLVVYSNEYENQDPLVFLSELRASQKIAKSFLKLYDSEGRDGGDVGGCLEEEELEFERYLKCAVQEDEEEETDVSCEFLTEFISKFF